MAYILLDPLARHRYFNLLERKRDFRLLEAEKKKGIWSRFKKTAKYTATGGEGTHLVKDLVMGGKASSKIGGMLGWDEKTSWIDRAQDVVDIVGVIDPTGVADAANALGYAARGKWGHAGVSALGIIPYAGDTAKIAKYGARAAKTGKASGRAARAGRLADTAKVVGRDIKMAKAAEVAAKPVGRFARMKKAAAKGRELYAKGKEYATRGKEAYEKIKARKERREAPTRREPTEFDTTADLGRRPTGALSGEAPPPSLAPPDPGEEAKAREAEQRKAAEERRQQEKRGGVLRRRDVEEPAPEPAAPERPGEPAAEPPAAAEAPEPTRPTGEGGRGPRGATLAPAAGKCPSPLTKTSVFGSPRGTKRCNKQTIPRDH
jgi:hypothetical protein